MKQKFQFEGVNSRIMLIMKEKNLNKNSLSKLLGISQPALKKIEMNQNFPSYKLLFEIISNFPDINSEWLLTGSGKMINTPTEDDLKIEPSNKLHYFEIFEMLKQSQRQVDDLMSMLKQSDKQLDDVLKMYNQLLEREKRGGIVHRGNDAECADVG